MIPDVDGQCASGAPPAAPDRLRSMQFRREVVSRSLQSAIGHQSICDDRRSRQLWLIVRAITDDGLLLSNGEHVGFVRAQATAAVPLTTAPSHSRRLEYKGQRSRARVCSAAPSGSSIAPNPAQTIDRISTESPAALSGVQFPSALPGQVQQQSGGGVQPFRSRRAISNRCRPRADLPSTVWAVT